MQLCSLSKINFQKNSLTRQSNYSLRPIPFIYPNHTKLYALCLDVLIVLGNALRLFVAKAILHTHTINVVHQTQQQQVNLLTYLAMTRFRTSFGLITSRRRACVLSRTRVQYPTGIGPVKLFLTLLHNYRQAAAT